MSVSSVRGFSQSHPQMKAALIPVGCPSGDTPMALMASSRSWRRAFRSTAESFADPPGWVCSTRMRDRRFSLLRKRTEGRAT